MMAAMITQAMCAQMSKMFRVSHRMTAKPTQTAPNVFAGTVRFVVKRGVMMKG